MSLDRVVLEELRVILGDELADGASDVRDVTLDSVSLLELVVRVEDRLGVSLPESAWTTLYTARDVTHWMGQAGAYD